MDRQLDDVTTRSWVLAALLKIVAHQPDLLIMVQNTVARFQKSMVVDLQQRAHEFLELAKEPATMQAVLPQHAYAEEVTLFIS